MSRYRHVRKAGLSDEQEQRGWASVDQLAFDQTVIGSGEHLSEPIYFGRAFDAPPQFSFSAVFSGEDAPEVRSIEYPHRLLTQAPGPAPSGLSDTRQAGGWVKDPSFELQGVWDSYIPRVWEWETWDFYQKINTENPLNTSPHYGTFRNFWVQGLAPSGGTYWSITDTEAATPLTDGSSEYSATVTINDNTYTPWLGPMFYPKFTPWEQHPGIPAEAIWPIIPAWIHPTNYVPENNPTYPLGFLEIKYPRQGEANWSLKVLSDQPIQIETYCNIWMFETQTEFGYFYDNLKEETVTHDVPANEWTELEHRFKLPSEIWPEDSFWNGDYYLGGFRFRAIGNPGTNVFVDEIYGWPNLTSRSLPFITIGVSEWIRDEQGMYVGAHLWYKVTNGAEFA